MVQNREGSGQYWMLFFIKKEKVSSYKQHRLRLTGAFLALLPIIALSLIVIIEYDVVECLSLIER